MGGGRLASEIGGKWDLWEVGSQNWWEFAPKTGRTEVEKHATRSSGVFVGLLHAMRE